MASAAPSLHSTAEKRCVWIWNNDRMVKKTITFVADLYTIFNEILVIAADKSENPNMTRLKVRIDVASNLITTETANGKGKNKRADGKLTNIRYEQCKMFIKFFDYGVFGLEYSMTLMASTFYELI
nr:DNA topoisomerase 2 isoform X2 [Tanacetum cinerariifolium]GFB24732.1 DNA topoisomerase 2 isoform X2 [Tanacetum cinerariifolium]